MKDEREVNFAAQLPVPDVVPQGDMEPRACELKRYHETFFNPKYDGFQNELEYVCDLPCKKSVDVKDSHLGAGFEVLDHRTAYDFDKVIPIMKYSGVKWARLQSGWQRAEKKEGVYDFGWLDHIVDELNKAGIHPWFSLSFGNGIYMEGAQPLPPHGNYFFSPTRFGERGIYGWTNYVKAMATHFKGRVDHYEVWNEPNAGFLRLPNTGAKIQAEEPEEYVKLVAITEKALHEVDKDAIVIAGAISGCAICNEYMQKLFKAGIAKYIDVFSYHPYGGSLEAYWGDRLEYIKELIKESGKDIRIWQGENGRPSDSIRLHRGYKSTEGSQARYLTRRYLTDLKLGLDMTSYFLCCDIGNGYLPNGAVHAQGVIDATNPDKYFAKLSFNAMQSMAYIFDSETKKVVGNFETNYPQGYSNTTLPNEYFVSTVACFKRKDVPIFTYYCPTHIDADYTFKIVNIQTWIDKEIYHFENPILIDPITAKVYRIKKMIDFCDGNYGYNTQFMRMPLLDYPLIVTDAKLLDDVGGEKRNNGVEFAK